MNIEIKLNENNKYQVIIDGIIRGNNYSTASKASKSLTAYLKGQSL